MSCQLAGDCGVLPPVVRRPVGRHLLQDESVYCPRDDNNRALVGEAIDDHEKKIILYAVHKLATLVRGARNRTAFLKVPWR
jgi:hypothetical protein